VDFVVVVVVLTKKAWFF